MRLYNYIKEDLEALRDFKKTLFDLRVAIKELEFHEGDPRPTEADKAASYDKKALTLKNQIMTLKEKVQKILKESGKSSEDLDDLLDSIPDKDSPKGIELQKKKERLAQRG